MADEQSKSLEEFGASFKGFLDHMASQAPAEDPVFLKLLRQHFSAEPAAFPVVAEQFEPSDHPNVQKAMAAYVEERECAAELVGITGDQAFTYSPVGIS